MHFRKNMLFIPRATVINRNLLLVLITAIFILLSFVISGNLFFTNKSKAAFMADSYKYYTSIEIQKGDTLWSIAEEHATAEYSSIQDYVSELKELNGLGGDEIHTGQYLTIAYYSQELK